MDTTSERGKCKARGLKENRKEIRQGRQVIKILYRRRVARQPGDIDRTDRGIDLMKVNINGIICSHDAAEVSTLVPMRLNLLALLRLRLRFRDFDF